MDSLAELVTQRVGSSLGADPLVRPSDHADFQANGVLAEAKRRGVPPRDLADATAAAIVDHQLLDAADVAGPGFINLTVATPAIWRQVRDRLADPRLGVGEPLAGERIVIDYSAPNIAKEMHVGHLRTTVIGDALARLGAFLGAEVIRQNHVGDWGTQFGMLIAYLEEHPDFGPGADETGSAAVARLTRLYQAASAAFKSDPEFAARAHAKVVAFQSGDEAALAVWREIVEESKRYFTEVYDLLGVLLTDDDVVGESFYNDRLPAIAAMFEDRGVAVVSDGALCVFFDDVRGPDGNPVPLIVRNSRGGFGYAATDLAVVEYRAGKLGATRVWYVVGAPQSLHFRMVFEAATRAGMMPPDVEFRHISFGSVLGPDGKPFKTRSGDPVRLIDLVNGAIDHARRVVIEKNPGLPEAEADVRAKAVGIGAVKYADLSVGRTRDYVFDLDRMVSLSGNTSVYLQYAHARVRSIMERVGPTARTIDPMVPMEPAERRLALRLDGFSAAVTAAATHAEPHRLAAYLYELAQALTGFWDACPVLKAPSAEIQANRVALCGLTARTLETGLGLLGIQAPYPL
jgi:arginyl-tRNA synthetase